LKLNDLLMHGDQWLHGIPGYLAIALTTRPQLLSSFYIFNIRFFYAKALVINDKFAVS